MMKWYNEYDGEVGFEVSVNVSLVSTFLKIKTAQGYL